MVISIFTFRGFIPPEGENWLRHVLSGVDGLRSPRNMAGKSVKPMVVTAISGTDLLEVPIPHIRPI